MVKGFPYTAVMNHNESEMVPIFKSVQKSLGLTFDDYRCGFYGRKSIFSFKNEKHFKLFELHCDLNGMRVHRSIDEAKHRPSSSEERATLS